MKLFKIPVYIHKIFDVYIILIFKYFMKFAEKLKNLKMIFELSFSQ